MVAMVMAAAVVRPRAARKHRRVERVNLEISTMRRAVVVGRPRAARKRCGRLCAFQRKFRVFQRAFRAARQGHRRAARARGGYRRAEECVDFTHTY